MNQHSVDQLSPITRILAGLSTVGFIGLVYLLSFGRASTEWWGWLALILLMALPAVGIAVVERRRQAR